MIRKKDILECIKSPINLFDWFLQRFHKRDENLWVFGAWFGELYQDNSRALFEWMNTNHKEIKTVWITNKISVRDEIRRKGLVSELTESKEGKKFCRNASVGVVSTSANDLCPKKLYGIKLVNVWHGMPLKRIGFDEKVPSKLIWKKVKTTIRKVLLPWEFFDFDLTISNSSFFVPFLSSAFKLPNDRIAITGSPRNDFLYDKTEVEFINKINNKFDNPLKILYMPTFRDVDRQNGNPFNPFTISGFDAERFNNLLQDKNIVFLYKGHFYDLSSESGVKVSFSNRFIKISGDEYDNLYHFVKECDILMTDYSSIYFDWLYLHKPVILFPLDSEEYQKCSRKFYFDYELMEGNKVYNWNEWFELIEKGTIENVSKSTFDRFCKFDDAKNCKRLLDCIMSKNKS